MAMGSLEYHLDQLVDAGLLTCLQGANKRYFPADVDRRDRPAIALLRQGLPRRVLLALLQAGTATKAGLLTALNVPTSTLNYHLQQLVAAGLVEAGHEGREAVYRVGDPPTVERLLVTYRATFLDRMVDAFLDGTGALR